MKLKGQPMKSLVFERVSPALSTPDVLQFINTWPTFEKLFIMSASDSQNHAFEAGLILPHIPQHGLCLLNKLELLNPEGIPAELQRKHELCARLDPSPPSSSYRHIITPFARRW